MNPVIRRRLPASVRSILTDIGPKEEWDDAEPETATTDGILLPSRGDVSGHDDFLAPAKVQEDGSNARRNAICMLCNCKPSSYTCPRCNLHYCGLACYQSPAHSVCSEAFYKESVMDELKHMGNTEDKEQKKMQEILVRLRQKAERADGGMVSVFKDVSVRSEEADEGEERAAEKVQVMMLLSRLAELQQSQGDNTAEIEDILRTLEDIGGADLATEDEDGVEQEEGELDVAERLSQMDLDKLSEEELWEILSSKEKEKFVDLMKSGALGSIVPLWKPWWEEHIEGALVEELSKPENEVLTTVDEDGVNNKVKTSQELLPKHDNSKMVTNGTNVKNKMKGKSARVPNVPPLSKKIPKLSSVCANPSPLIRFNLVNALFGYTFTLCRFNGDTDSLMFEFCEMILGLSETLHSSKVFNSVQEAVECGEALILRGGYLDKDDPEAPTRAVEAVAHIMTGRDRKDATGYCLAALSQLRSALSQARSSLSKEGEEGTKRQKYFLASKKCEFFQAWVLDNAAEIHGIAIELWTEHGKRQSKRNNLLKAKTVLEENLKKLRKGTSKLIEEMSQ